MTEGEAQEKHGIGAKNELMCEIRPNCRPLFGTELTKVPD